MRRPKMPMFFTTVGVVLFGLGAAVLSSWVLGLVVFGVLPDTWIPGPAAPATKLTWLDPVKVALTVAAGIGGAVALVVAYRKQRMAERQELESVYVAAAAQLGDASPTVRMAGVYAMANLADSWPDRRQQCVDVLCAYLRVPWNLTPDADHPLATKTIEVDAGGTKSTYAYPDERGELEVRKTILRVIGEHLRKDQTLASWTKLSLDFTGATLPEIGWANTSIPSDARFAGATFSDVAFFVGSAFAGNAYFDEVTFSDTAYFGWVTFAGNAYFEKASFDGESMFDGATFVEDADFSEAMFNDEATFRDVTFNGGFRPGTAVRVDAAAQFGMATFAGNAVFHSVAFNAHAEFRAATFVADATFDQATFNGAAAFQDTRFNGQATFDQATFNGDGGLQGAVFQGPSSPNPK